MAQENHMWASRVGGGKFPERAKYTQTFPKVKGFFSLSPVMVTYLLCSGFERGYWCLFAH